MKCNGILDKVRNAFLAGESRDNLNKIYNKGTVTKVYNKLIKNNKLDIKLTLDESKVKEEKIYSLIQEILLLADKNKEYTFTIKIKENKLENKKSVDLINPFKLA
ncbi:hypothetical protein, partial [Clostridium sp.]|uniref:hypothetical protein n=1 Tax=Clostridium sp. TaxID=1506 RepID=UPI0026286B43